MMPLPVDLQNPLIIVQYQSPLQAQHSDFALIRSVDMMNSIYQSTILNDIQSLSPAERLEVIEAAVQLLRVGLRVREAQSESRQRLSVAAEALLQDYTEDVELTAFTAIDGDDFYA